MKKLFYPMAFMMLFSCQNDQTESANPTTNAIAKRGCASQVLAAQLAADPTLVLRMNDRSFYSKVRLTRRLVNGKIEILLLLMYCTEPQLRHFRRSNSIPN
jgi:hypothetical protein